MSTLRNAVDVLIFSLCLPPFLLSSTTTSHTKGSLVWACMSPLREALLEAGAAQLLHPAPGEGGGGYWWSPQRYQEVGSTRRDTRRHRVVFPGSSGFSDVPSSLRLLPPPPDLGVSGPLQIDCWGLQAYLPACLCLCVGIVLYVPERPAVEPLLMWKLVVSTLWEADDRAVSTQSALCWLISIQVWGQELSSRWHPACMSHRHTEAIRPVRKQTQGHVLVQL